MAGVVSISALLILYVVIMLFTAIFVYTDAKRRDMSPAGWALIAFFVPFLLGLIIYLVCRKPLVDFQCPNCGAGLTAYARECPKCGHSMLTQCPECEFPVQRGWKTCPRCGTRLPEQFEQPVRNYRKDNGGLIIIIVLVILIGLIMLLSGLFNLTGNYSVQSYGGMSGMYNITSEELSENEAIASWLKECEESSKEVFVLLSKESNTCLVYVKDSSKLMESEMNVEYRNGEECLITVFSDESSYEDTFGYDFFLYELKLYDDIEVDVFLNGDMAKTEVTTTAADISLDTWGGAADERQ